MPIWTPDTVKTTGSDGTSDPCGAYSAEHFSDSGGLTQFGAFVETLQPGSSSSFKHWHAREDEMVYMLEGEALVHEGDRKTPLLPGQAATFKAGAPDGHCIENTSSKPAKYLVIGTRLDGDVITYPDHDRVLTWNNEDGETKRRWTDHAGAEASNLYKPA